MTKDKTPKAKFTPEYLQPLWRDDDGFIAQGTGENYKTFADTNVNDDDIDDRENRTEIIIAAYNGTVAKGYDPEAMEDLYKALKLANMTLKELAKEAYEFTSLKVEIESALKNAKLKDNDTP